MDAMYYESHITVEPVFEERLERFKELCAPYAFKPAKLLMKKRNIDTPVRSEYDTFCTGKNKNHDKLRDSMLLLVQSLTNDGFKVWRYKIEAILLDVKLKDDDALLRR